MLNVIAKRSGFEFAPDLGFKFQVFKNFTDINSIQLVFNFNKR
jgi:hypothetical protein